MEDMKKRLEDLEKFKDETIIMFQRIQKALGVSVSDEKGDFQVKVLMPKKENYVGIISGMLATLSKLKSSVEKISDERKIIIPKF